MFNSIYHGKKVLVTGHTGFKGSWLCSFLRLLGAEVCGIALPPETPLSHWQLLDIPMPSLEIDIRDREKLIAAVKDFQPEFLFHLAAQPIVRYSYEIPAETFDTNVMGTVNILEACRQTPSLRSAVIITSDKCYENREQLAGYTENDPMGGFDPYSASKGCAELVVSSYRRSFFHPDNYGKSHHLLLASARAGNVIGGGDWAKDRLVPDIMQAAAKGEPALIRNPLATRPWQHVLEPLSGYLLLGQKLYEGDISAASPWNFGPAADGVINVQTACAMLQGAWEKISFEIAPVAGQPHEAKLLTLDCSKAEKLLRWHGVFSAEEMFGFTSQWYKEFYTDGKVITAEQLAAYLDLAEKRNLSWMN